MVASREADIASVRLVEARLEGALEELKRKDSILFEWNDRLVNHCTALER